MTGNSSLSIKQIFPTMSQEGQEVRMSLTTIDTVLFVTSLAVYSVVGTTGNVLVLLVYHRKTNAFILTSFVRLLGCIDLLVCGVIIPYTIAFELHHVSDEFSCRFFELLRHFSIFASNATLLAVAVERFYAVCRPLQRLNEEQIMKGVIVIVIFGVVAAVPAVFMFTVSDPYERQINGTERNQETDIMHEYCHFTTEYLGKSGTLLYQGFSMFWFFGAVLVLSVFYSLVYFAVWKRSKVWCSNRIVPIESKMNGSSTPSFTFSTTLKEIGNETSKIVEKTAGNTNCLVVPSINDSPSLKPNRTCCDFDQARLSPAWVNRDSKQTDGPSVAADSVSKTRRGISQVNGTLHTINKGTKIHHKTAKMLFVCTLVFVIAWIPFWLDVFNITKSVPLRFQFFISYATNPIIYGIVNRHIRNSIASLIRSCLSYVCFFGQP